MKTFTTIATVTRISKISCRCHFYIYHTLPQLPHFATVALLCHIFYSYTDYTLPHLLHFSTAATQCQSYHTLKLCHSYHTFRFITLYNIYHTYVYHTLSQLPHLAIVTHFICQNLPVTTSSHNYHTLPVTMFTPLTSSHYHSSSRITFLFSRLQYLCYPVTEPVHRQFSFRFSVDGFIFYFCFRIDVEFFLTSFDPSFT